MTRARLLILIVFFYCIALVYWGWTTASIFPSFSWIAHLTALGPVVVLFGVFLLQIWRDSWDV